jgi:hypothetical protein
VEHEPAARDPLENKIDSDTKMDKADPAETLKMLDKSFDSEDEMKTVNNSQTTPSQHVRTDNLLDFPYPGNLNFDADDEMSNRRILADNTTVLSSNSVLTSKIEPMGAAEGVVPLKTEYKNALPRRRSKSKKGNSPGESSELPKSVSSPTVIDTSQLVDPNKKRYAIEYPFKLIEHQTELNNLLYYVIRLCFLFVVNVTIFMPIVLLFVCISWPLHLLQHAMFRLFHFFHLTKTSFLSPHKPPEFLTPIELFWLYNSNFNKVCIWLFFFCIIFTTLS